MRAKRPGFTLVELLIVITIIGILLAFILKASIGALKRAEHAATVSLITKLNEALTDRTEALSRYYPTPTPTHFDLAAIYPGGTFAPIVSPQRAQVIAQFDYVRAELPDVFVPDTADTDYPLNFAATRFNPTGAAVTNTAADWVLPLGGGLLIPGSAPPAYVPVTGMKGASFAAAGAIYKQLGYGPRGIDGADNDQDGKIDEWDEGIAGLSTAEVDLIRDRLKRHTHKTARSEMLYAILVEGSGPLGSSFTRDDFGPNDIKDTDGDGLMEFVDAWGEPLQFYRWPIMYRSDSQKGFPDLAKLSQDSANSVSPGPYSTVYEAREQDPLDPNQQLQAPGWWGSFNKAYPWSAGPRATFGAMFHTLVDPLATAAGAPSNSTYWDRSTSASAGFYNRRAYYSRFLVLSGGPDKRPGTAMLSVLSDPKQTINYQELDERSSYPTVGGGYATARDKSGAPVAATVANVITIENQGGKIDPNRTSGAPPTTGTYRNDTSTLLESFAEDDITSHNLHAAGGAMPSTSP